MNSPEITPYLARPPQFAPREPNLITRLLSDRALLFLFAAALLMSVTLAVYLLLRFEGLSEALPLHFDASGLPDRIDSKTAIFGLPLIGFLVLLLNAFLAVLAHRAERAASTLLAASALLMQVLMWFAAVNIVGGLF